MPVVAFSISRIHLPVQSLRGAHKDIQSFRGANIGRVACVFIWVSACFVNLEDMPVLSFEDAHKDRVACVFIGVSMRTCM